MVWPFMLGDYAPTDAPAWRQLERLVTEDEVGGYPKLEATRAPFREADWNLATMTPKSGLYPGEKAGAQEHLSPRDRAMRNGAQ